MPPISKAKRQSNPVTAPDSAVFHRALQIGDTRVVQDCLDRGADLAARFNGRTPLHVAAECAPDLLQLLLRHGADLEAKDSDGLTAAGRVVRSAAQLDDKVRALGILDKHGAIFDADTTEEVRRLSERRMHRVLHEFQSGPEIQRKLNANLDGYVANYLEFGDDEKPAKDSRPCKEPRSSRKSKQPLTDDSEDIVKACAAVRDEDRLRSDTFQLNVEGQVTMMYSTPEEKAQQRYARNWLKLGQYDRALRYLEKLVAAEALDVYSQQLLAWILATCPEERLRDGARALRIAREVDRTCLTAIIVWENDGSLTRWWLPGAAEALAAALADQGQLRRALLILDDIELDKVPRAHRELIERMRACFQAGQPFREAPPAPELAARGRALAAAYPKDGPEAPEFVIDAGHLKLQRKGFGTEGVRRLLAEPGLRKVTSLTISSSSLGANEVLLLAKELDAKRLTHLDLSNNVIPDAAAAVLLGQTRWPKLRELDLENNKLGVETARAIAQNSTLRGLEKLTLSHNELRCQGVAALAESPYLGNLKELHLHENWISDDGLCRLASASSLNRLQVLDVRSNYVSVKDLKALAQSPLIARLRKLDLGWNHLGDDEARALATAPLGRLVELYLWHNQLRSPGIAALAGSRLLESVRILYLSGNPIGPKGILALATSTHVAKLRRLDLTDCTIPNQSAVALAESVSLKQLKELRVSRERISSKAMAILRERFGPGLQCH